ncbi:MAG: OmpH family outer membrane protein [Alphaproteobacteria bacterium]
MDAKFRRVLAAFLLLGLLWSLPHGSAQAQTEPAATIKGIAVFRLLDILNDSVAMQDFRARRDAAWEAYRASVKAEEEALVAADEDLAAQRSLLTQEVFAQRRQELLERVRAFQQKEQEARSALDRAQGQAQEEISRAILEVVSAYATEKKLELVLEQSQVYLNIRALDITNDILQRLDGEKAQLAVTIPPIN